MKTIAIVHTFVVPDDTPVDDGAPLTWITISGGIVARFKVATVINGGTAAPEAVLARMTGRSPTDFLAGPRGPALVKPQ